VSVSLLLAGPPDALTAVRVARLTVELLQTDLGGDDVVATFRPNRTDDLHLSAKVAAQLSYRVLLQEGLIRSQLVVRFEVEDAVENVLGRSADLAFALAILCKAYGVGPSVRDSAGPPLRLAATGILEADATVSAVDQAPAKLRAAVRELSPGPAIVFFPAANAAEPEVVSLLGTRTTVEFVPVRHLEDALERLGIELERVCLRNPFRGLERFDYEHRSIFFGRRTEVGGLLRQLLRREQAGTPGVLVEGPSGSGKSSFLRAGILPALVDTRHQPPGIQDSMRVRPVSRGLRGSVWRPGLLPSGADEATVVRSIRHCWTAFPEWLVDPETVSEQSFEACARHRREHWPNTHRFVWVVDQFEELFALGLSDDLLERFGGFLRALQADGAWTLASIRSDAVPQLKRHEALRNVYGANEGQYYLPTIHGVALDEVICAPARAASLTFGLAPDGWRVDQLLRDEVYRETDSLPLLQFTLNELYLRRSGQELTYDAYVRLGGLSGSIVSAAGKFLRMGAGDLQGLFRTLVSVDDVGRAIRRYAPVAEFARHAVQHNLISELIAARLCTVDQREGEPTVAFTHDSVLTTLPVIAEWLQREGALLQTREIAQRDARLWQQHCESNSWLAASDKVLLFQTLEDADIALLPEVQRFIDRSRTQRRRNSRLKQVAVALIGGLAVSASIAAWIASTKQREAAHESAAARRAELQLLTEAAAERLKDGDLIFARGIILEVLRRTADSVAPDPAAVNVLLEIMASDPARAILAGHTGAVRKLAYSRDGSRIATSSLDGTARIWDARTGVQLLLLRVHPHQPDTAVYADIVKTAVFSPDGTRVLTAANPGSIETWELRTGAAHTILADHIEGLEAAAYSRDGTLIVAAAARFVRVFDARTGVRVRDLGGPGGDFETAEFSPDGARIVAASADGTARVWSAPSGKQLLVLTGHHGELRSATFSADGTRILTSSADGTARIWDTHTGALLVVLSGHVGELYCAAYSPDGTLVATTGVDKTVRVWDAASGRQLRLLSGHVEGINGVSFSPDNRHLVSGGWDNTGRVWDLQEGHEAAAITRHDDRVISVGFSQDGERLLSSSSDGTAIISKSNDGARLTVIADPDFGGRAVYAPDGHRILTFAGRGLRIRDVASGAPLVSIGPLDGELGWVSAAFSPDGRNIIETFDDFSVAIRDASTGSPMRKSKPIHSDYIANAEYSPDGRHILTASVDGTVRISDADTFGPVAVLPHKDTVTQAAYSPDGLLIVTAAGDGMAHVWDVRTARESRVLAGHHAGVSSVAFSSDGRRIATGSRDRTARIWDTDTGVELAVLTGHGGDVTAVSFSPDGRQIATASADHAARIWSAIVPASLREEVLWEAAVESDPLPDVQRTVLGFPSTMALLANDALRAGRGRVEPKAASGNSACGNGAAAYYDPDRVTPGLDQASINASVAALACSASVSRPDASGQTHYQAGRALVASEDFAGALRQFETAVLLGYRAANVDLGILLTNPSASMLDGRRAALAFKQAWDSGVAIGGFELASLYERGLQSSEGSGESLPADATNALAWLELAAKRGEPHALARLAERAELSATSQPDKAAGFFLRAFTLYTSAAERARREGWPDATWRAWRYRRATLARLLADDGRMPTVARIYAAIMELPTP
jgi:WD40 repeat protein/TPR repeat protein